MTGLFPHSVCKSFVLSICRSLTPSTTPHTFRMDRIYRSSWLVCVSLNLKNNPMILIDLYCCILNLMWMMVLEVWAWECNLFMLANSLKTTLPSSILLFFYYFWFEIYLKCKIPFVENMQNSPSGFLSLSLLPSPSLYIYLYLSL